MKADFYSGNRAELSRRVGGELVIVTANTKMQNVSDSASHFQQEANFWYLTGIEQADWRLIIDGKQQMSWLIAPDMDATHKLFDGGLDALSAQAISGVDEVLTQEEGKRRFADLAKKYSTVHTVGSPAYAKYADFVLNPAPELLRGELSEYFDSVKDCQKQLSKLRAIKQPVEIDAMIRASEISIGAFDRAKLKLPSHRHEYEIEAELTYYFRRHNAVHAFEPIVASGKNACTLHYTDNKSSLEPGELLLIDSGARTNSYSADITRTYAVGEPTLRQRAVHQAVQQAEKAIIELIKPGLLVKSYVEAVDIIMKDALLSLGLIKTNSDSTAYRHYFPHAVSHGLGLDVHESLGEYKELRAGMVLTVEPGIYIPEEGIGVRIEDDILITEDGYRNLTAGLSTDL